MTALLDGRAALVTGGARGIGEAIVRRLVADGARVAVNDVDDDAAERLAEKLRVDGHEVVAAPGDVTSERDVAAAVERCRSSFGGLDVLVNNAGIEHRALLREHDLDAWRRVLGVNLDGPFVVARAAVDLLARSEAPAVVNICSTAVIGFFGQAAYDASKGGLLTLTRSLAVELGREGIRVNAVCPGFVETPMLEVGELRTLAEKTVRALPLRRMARPEEIAAAVAWLASPEAGYVTGQALFVDGGWVRG